MSLNICTIVCIYLIRFIKLITQTVRNLLVVPHVGILWTSIGKEYNVAFHSKIIQKAYLVSRTEALNTLS